MDMLKVVAPDKAAYRRCTKCEHGTRLDTRCIFKEKYVAMFFIQKTWNDAKEIDYAYKFYSSSTF